MGVEEGMRNGDGPECDERVQHLNGDVLANGFAVGIRNCTGDGGSCRSETLQTYKRRKLAKACSQGNVLDVAQACEGVTGQLTNLIVKDPREENKLCEQASLPRMDSCATIDRSHDFSEMKSRNVVLEHMYHMLSEDHGDVHGCIQEALLFHKKVGCLMTIKESVYRGGDKGTFPSQTRCIHNCSKKTDKAHKIIASNGSIDGSNHHNTTEQCQRAFCNIIISEKFALLCKLLLENFEGSNVGGFFDSTLMNSRMKEGAYEQSPMLFYSDIQQVWKKLQEIGTEMASLAKSLSDMSRTSYLEQVGVSALHTLKDGKHELITPKSDSHIKQYKTEGHGARTACKQCGEKVTGRDCLICDWCEDICHVSCSERSVEEVLSKSWYCADCSSRGIGMPHENCLVCKKLTTSRTLVTGVGGENTIDELEENSSSSMEGVPTNSYLCKVCGIEVENGERQLKCRHRFCSNKYYHERCLTSKQAKMYAHVWYCPSCLCRTCLTDQDDDKIVMCDGCDHAYHLYCMKPPRISIPKGKWFCQNCEAGIQEIRRAKRAYEIVEDTLKKKGEKKPSDKGSEESDEGRGGMDMLLSAAKTLRYEENMGAPHMKS